MQDTGGHQFFSASATSGHPLAATSDQGSGLNTTVPPTYFKSSAAPPTLSTGGSFPTGYQPNPYHPGTPHTAVSGYMQNTPPNADLEISVVEPTKQGEGVSAHICYKVRSRPLLSGPTAPPASEVVRRFRDFSWLQYKMQERHKGVIIPPLPEKSAVQKFQMGTDFIEQRRRALQVYLSKVVSHPVLKEVPELNTFLRANEEEWTMEMARWQAETAASSKPAVGGAMQWFRNLQHSAQNMVSGRSDDSSEDPAYLKVRDYINSLEAHLVEAQRQAGRLARKEGELAAALAEFGNAAEGLGKFDSQGLLRGSFDILCARAGQVATTSRQRAERLSATFEIPLQQQARAIKSVQSAMSDRSVALSAYVLAKGDLDSKKLRLARLRATPGLSEGKVVEAERETMDAEEKVCITKLAYDTIVSRMTEELNRFQKERSVELSILLKELALTQAQSASENAQAWSSLLADIQQQQQMVRVA
ncbi:hypothetical protein CEUSTIGMA_g9385.t1 [Chlamydomonas eustigma]|uniref:PX domain-containing protein n=1 Tax=Chlamydomonas eustigma TaxID=1157962 RepID=A0A250XFW3_9CHLO|nr:hypothetical protein CEUSTIGMA_g9385.t1 [Chlamydomonas eustigma]|eukprot:GAX81957.1 hypothetical protein CEUSTIGMA_g9385.t1 [Chlamydomonas eustigma]